MQASPADQLEERICGLSAQIHAATAELVGLTARLDSEGSWYGIGVRTCAHWMSIQTGMDVVTGSELIRVCHALETLPKLAAAFADGRLSYDKIRAVTRVATPDDEDVWLGLALEASGAQLIRICRTVRRALEAADPDVAEDALGRRSLRTWWRDDGMLEIFAVLPREDGAAVVAALEASARAILTELREAAPAQRAVDDPARITHEMLRADALIRVADEWIGSVSREPTPAPTKQVVVHLDSRVLTDSDAGVRCHLEDGPWLSIGAARWLGCDSDVVAILERDGSPLDAGRAHRVISPRLRLALQARDRGCRYPGCGVPACRTDGHHIRHWFDGGRTDLKNLISLSRFHHRRHHEGAFAIRVVEGATMRFELADGTPMQQMAPMATASPLVPRSGIPLNAAAALSGGENFDLGYAVGVIADVCEERKGAGSRDP
jgi:hypothetical protein